MTYFIYKADGQSEVGITERPMTLKQLQVVVGGYIEHVHDFLRKTDLYCNEDGRLTKLPPNPFFPGSDLMPALCGDVIEGRHENSKFAGVPSGLQPRTL